MASYTLEIIGSIANAQKEFAKIPGFTEQSAARAAQAWAKNQEKMRREAEKTADRIAKEMSDASKASAEKLGALQKIGEKTFGGIVGDVVDVAESMNALGPAGMAAAAGFLAIGAGAVGLAAATGAVIGLERAAVDYVAGLEKIQSLDLVTPEQRDAIFEANAALDALGIVAMKLATDLAAELGPAVADAAAYLADIGFRAIDVTEAFYSTHSVLESLALFLTGGFLRALAAPISVMVEILRVGAQVEEHFGVQGSTTRKLVDSYDSLISSMAQGITGFDGLKDASTETNEEQTRGQRLIAELRDRYNEASEAQGRHSASTRQVTVDYEKQGEALRRLQGLQGEAGEDQLTAYEKTQRQIEQSYRRRVDAAYEAFGQTAMGERELTALQMALDETRARFRRDMDAAELADLERQSDEAVASIQRRYEAEQAFMAAQKAQRDQAHAEEMARQAEAEAAWQEVYDEGTRLLFDRAESVHETMMEEKRATIEAIEDRLANEKGLTSNQRQELQTRLDNERASANNTAKIQKGLAVFEILLQNAVAMAKAIAVAGPPLNVPAIAAQMALTALHTAAALAAPLPKFHSGSGRMMPDETPAVIRRGEAVLSERAVQEMNRGSAPSGGGNVQQIFWNGRLMSEVVGMAMAQPGPARRFVEARLPTGRGYRG
jgi:hypothetical protein